MRILIAHVAYRQRGGEDVVVANETELLRQAGHDVRTLIVPSAGFDALSVHERGRIALHMGDHAYGRRLIHDAVESVDPDVVHFHNLYPLLGPGAIREAAQMGCATVQTYHNYRLSCIAGTHFRNGVVCERCAPGDHTHGALFGCYRASRAQSCAMALGASTQWRMLVKERLPHRGICLTDFMRDRLIAHGAPASSLVVKANSVAAGDPLPASERSGAVYVGRLSEEKGILQLLRAWAPDAPHLEVIGDGPLRSQVELDVAGKANISYRGAQDHRGAREALRRARVLAFPSLWFEGLPLVVLEALSEGTPIVGFNAGSLARGVVADGLWTVLVGQWPRLVEKCSSLVGSMMQKEWTMSSEGAQRMWSRRFSPSANLKSLLSIYETVAQERGAK